ncbi:MAG: hypothetical protein ACRD0K_21590 [Egibacteraceae bacterium]
MRPTATGDGWVTVDELYIYVYDQVRATTPYQTPTWSAHGSKGELVLARNPHPPPPVEPALLPFELRQAVESELAWQRQGAVVGLRRLLAGDRPEVALSATQALRQLATDGDPDVRAAVAAALATLQQPIEPQAALAHAPQVEEGGQLTERRERPVTPLRTSLRSHGRPTQPRQGAVSAPRTSLRSRRSALAIAILLTLVLAGAALFVERAQPAFALPYGLAVDADGNLYIADKDHARVRRVDRSGTMVI